MYKYMSTWGQNTEFAGMPCLPSPARKPLSGNSEGWSNPSRIILLVWEPFGNQHGASFTTPSDGIEAQFQHWHAYYYGGNLPSGTKVPDPRRDAVLKSGWAGKLQYVEDLGGRWAPSPDYGSSIVNDYMKVMQSSESPGSGATRSKTLGSRRRNCPTKGRRANRQRSQATRHRYLG